jgi:hypothetical protein
MPDEKPCNEHSAEIGELKGKLPGIQRELEQQGKLIRDIHRCVKGDNGKGLGEVARGAAEELDKHLESHKFYWRNVIILLGVGIITGVTVGMAVANLVK